MLKITLVIFYVKYYNIGNGDEATCKKVMKQPNGIMLVSLNPVYAPMFYPNQEIEELPITILGKVVELRAKFN